LIALEREKLSKLGAIIILLLILGMFWVALVDPLINFRRDLSSSITAAQAEKSRLTRSIANLNRQLANTTASNVSEQIWRARQSGEAIARIQAQLGRLSQLHGVTLRSITPTNATGMPYTETTALRVEGEANLAQLEATLLEIEKHTPALLVDRATIRRLSRTERRSEQPYVFFQLDITAPIQITGVD